MKKICLSLAFILLIAGQQLQSQVLLDSELTEKWSELTTNLDRRNDLVVSMSKLLDKAGFKKPALLKAMQSNAENFHNYLDTILLGKHDVVVKTAKEAEKVSASIGKVMVEIENQPELRENQELQALWMQLEGTENRIGVFTHSYNLACIKHKRGDLAYPQVKAGLEVKL